MPFPSLRLAAGRLGVIRPVKGRDRDGKRLFFLIFIRFIHGKVRPQQREKELHQLLVVQQALRRAPVPGQRGEEGVLLQLVQGGGFGDLRGAASRHEQVRGKGLPLPAHVPGQLKGDARPEAVPEQGIPLPGVGPDRFRRLLDDRPHGEEGRFAHPVFAPRQLDGDGPQRGFLRPRAVGRRPAARMGKTEKPNRSVWNPLRHEPTCHRSSSFLS